MTVAPGIHRALLMLALTAAPLQAQTSADSARSLFTTRVRAAGIPGAQLVVLVQGRVALSVAFGFADTAGQVAVTDTTLFRAGSISKLATATAAARLWEAGRLDLDAPVERLVPEFAAKSGVTPRLLAGHLAGVRHYIGRDFATAPRRYGDVIEALSIFAADTLFFSPGARYFYSSYGYNLLGAAVQRAAAEEFRLHLQRTIFAPFGMNRTLFERSDSAIGALAQGFAPGSPPRPATRTDLSDRWPSGGMLSTALDLARFGEASVRGALLTDRVRELLFTGMRTGSGAETGVGFGWRVGRDPAGRTVYHHGGASTGGRAMLMVWRDAEVVVAITTNVSSWPGTVSEADAMALGALFIR